MKGSNIPMWVPVVIPQQASPHVNNTRVTNVITKVSQPGMVVPVQQVIQVPQIQPAQPVKVIKLQQMPAVKTLEGVTIIPKGQKGSCEVKNGTPLGGVKMIPNNAVHLTKSVPSVNHVDKPSTVEEPTQINSSNNENMVPSQDIQLVNDSDHSDHGNHLLAGDIQLSPVTIATDRGGGLILEQTEEHSDQITFVGHSDLDLRSVLQPSHSSEQDKDGNHDTNLTDLEALLHQSSADTSHCQVPDEVTLNVVRVIQADDQIINTDKYCVDCDQNYPGPSGCAQHQMVYPHHPDTPILSRARMSVPNSLIIKSESRGKKGVDSVWSSRNIAKGTRFGPLVAEDITQPPAGTMSEQSNIWKIFGDAGVTRTLCFSDEEHSNWMMFVSRACHHIEQNMTVYQEGQEIYFISNKAIEAGKELFYWYSKPYAQLIGESVVPQESLKCIHCGKQSTDKAALHKHLRYAHADSSGRKWKCHMCQKAFQTSGKLNTHMMGHLGFKPHVCTVCKKQFTDKSNLRMHMTIHTGEKKFKCVECGRAFRLKAHLETHMLTHTKVKNLFCSYCNRAFARKSDLTAHTLQHTRENVIKCPICNKEFFKKQNYQKHFKTHTGIRDHVCDYCKRGFGVYFHLKRHMKNCHAKLSKKENTGTNSDEKHTQLAESDIQKTVNEQS